MTFSPRSLRKTLTLLPILLLAPLFPAPHAAAQDSYLGWHTDLERAAEIAAEKNKPIFLVFRCVR